MNIKLRDDCSIEILLIDGKIEDLEKTYFDICQKYAKACEYMNDNKIPKDKKDKQSKRFQNLMKSVSITYEILKILGVSEKDLLTPFDGR